MKINGSDVSSNSVQLNIKSIIPVQTSASKDAEAPKSNTGEDAIVDITPGADGNIDIEDVDRFTETLYDAINAKKYGIFDGTPDNLYDKIINNVNASNIDSVLYVYEELDGESLVSALFKEGTLNKEQKLNLAEYLVKCQLQSVENSSDVNIDDLYEELDNALGKEKGRKFSSMDSSEIDKIVNASIFRRSRGYELENEANGKVDESFKQGNIGDCWLLASINSIAATPKGAKILNDSLKVNDDGSIDVTFKGLNLTYNVSADELKEKKGKYSTGDIDVRAIEIAAEKYFKEHPDEIGRESVNTIENGGRAAYAYEMFLGKGGPSFWSGTLGEIAAKPFIVNDELIENIKDPNFICTVGCGTVGGKGKELSKIEAEDEYGNSVKIMTDHSYSAINADDEYVYLTEPSGKYGTIKMTHKSFKSAFNHANFTDLN